MPQFPWIRRSSIDVRRIDEEHAFLLKILSNISLALRIEDDKKAIINARLFNETISSHFSYEEELMRRIDYPRKDEHIFRHELAKAQVSSLLTELGMGAPPASIVEQVSAIAANFHNTLLTDDLRLVSHLERA